KDGDVTVELGEGVHQLLARARQQVLELFLVADFRRQCIHSGVSLLRQTWFVLLSISNDQSAGAMRSLRFGVTDDPSPGASSEPTSSAPSRIASCTRSPERS